MWPLLSRGNFEAVRSPEHSKLLFAGEHVPGVPCTTNGNGSLLTPVGLPRPSGPRSAICRDSTSPRRLLPTKMLLPAPDTTSVASNSRCTQSSPACSPPFAPPPNEPIYIYNPTGLLAKPPNRRRSASHTSASSCSLPLLPATTLSIAAPFLALTRSCRHVVFVSHQQHPITRPRTPGTSDGPSQPILTFGQAASAEGLSAALTTTALAGLGVLSSPTTTALRPTPSNTLEPPS